MRIQQEQFRPSKEIMAASVRDVIRWALEGDIDTGELHECIESLVEHEQRGLYPRYWIATPLLDREQNINFSFKTTQFMIGSLGLSMVVVNGYTEADIHPVELTRDSDFEIFAEPYQAA